MNDTDWFLRFDRSPHAYEPRRDAVVLEVLRPGDVTADGTIVLYHGGTTRTGPVWVNERQALNATYYGWDMAEAVDLASGVSACVGIDEPAYLMERKVR
jgi:hypothetical protein